MTDDDAVFARFCQAAGEMYAAGLAFARADSPELYQAVSATLANGGVPTLLVEWQPTLAVSMRVTGADADGDPVTIEVFRCESRPLARA